MKQSVNNKSKLIKDQKIKTTSVKTGGSLSRKVEGVPAKFVQKRPVDLISGNKAPRIATRRKLGGNKSSALLQGPSTGSNGLLSSVLALGGNIAKGITDISTGNVPGVLADIPNTILSVVDTTQGVMRALNDTDTKEKVIVKDKVNLREKGNQVLLDKIAESVPVITTTQIPTSYATEVSPPQISHNSYIDSATGRTIHRYMSTYQLSKISNPNSGTESWVIGKRMNPSDASVWGDRMRTIAGLYQMHRLVKSSAQYIPIVGTEYAGNILLNYNEGTDLASQFDPSVTAQIASQRECIAIGTGKQGFNLTYTGKGDWLYNTAATGDDIKFSNSATFGVKTFNFGSAYDYDVGFILMTNIVEFLGAVESPLAFSGQVDRLLCACYSANYPVNSFQSFLHFLKLVTKQLKNMLDYEDEGAWVTLEPRDDEPGEYDAITASLGQLCSDDEEHRVIQKFEKIGKHSFTEFMKVLTYKERTVVNNVRKRNPILSDTFSMGIEFLNAFSPTRAGLMNLIKSSIDESTRASSRFGDSYSIKHKDKVQILPISKTKKSLVDDNLLSTYHSNLIRNVYQAQLRVFVSLRFRKLVDRAIDDVLNEEDDTEVLQTTNLLSLTENMKERICSFMSETYIDALSNIMYSSGSLIIDSMGNETPIEDEIKYIFLCALNYIEKYAERVIRSHYPDFRETVSPEQVRKIIEEYMIRDTIPKSKENKNQK